MSFLTILKHIGPSRCNNSTSEVIKWYVYMSRYSTDMAIKSLNKLYGQNPVWHGLPIRFRSQVSKHNIVPYYGEKEMPADLRMPKIQKLSAAKSSGKRRSSRIKNKWVEVDSTTHCSTPNATLTVVWYPVIFPLFGSTLPCPSQAIQKYVLI